MRSQGVQDTNSSLPAASRISSGFQEHMRLAEAFDVEARFGAFRQRLRFYIRAAMRRDDKRAGLLEDKMHG
jgi:hypothetical protein